jgi:hypothetical protein
MQPIFTCLIALQFVVIVTHDFVNIPGWSHGTQVQSTVGRNKLWAATAINAIFPGIAVALAIWFWNAPKPNPVMNYWVIYCAITLASVSAMWYYPYFFGASQQKRREYEQMYAGTRHVLPPRGCNPRPNLLHVCFHILFAINLVLAIAIRF